MLSVLAADICFHMIDPETFCWASQYWLVSRAGFAAECSMLFFRADPTLLQPLKVALIIDLTPSALQGEDIVPS